MAGMDRRLAGIAVVVLALVAVVVAPSVDGRRVAGTAVASTFPEPPGIGDCLQRPFPADVVHDGPVPQIPVTAAHFGSCSGLIAGEVVGVWQSAEAAESAGPRTRGPCYLQAAEFAGLELSGRSMIVPGLPATGPLFWSPTIGFHPYLVVPGVKERSAGRSWSACLVVPSGRLGYHGTLRAAFTTGQFPVDYGLCWSGSDLDMAPRLLDCTALHSAELLATGWVRDRSQVSRDEMDAECLRLAATMMRTGDPTRQGALQIVLDPVRRDGAATPDAPMSVGCFAQATDARQLSDTVIGLDDRPPPLAG